jgi:hypothetical protein
VTAIPSRPLSTEEAKEAERNSWSEAVFTTKVIELATACGWLVCHFRAARTVHGWRTAIQGHRGFFDIVAIRGTRIILAELKVKRGQLSLEQQEWLSAAMNAMTTGSRHEVYVWRPEDWDDIARTLSREDS